MYVIYALSALLLVVILIRGLVKGYAMKRIAGELATPLRYIIISLAVWFSYIYVAKELGSRF